MKKIYLTPAMAAMEIQFSSLLMVSDKGQPDEPGGTPDHHAPGRVF